MTVRVHKFEPAKCWRSPICKNWTPWKSPTIWYVCLSWYSVWIVYFYHWADDFCKIIEEDARERAEKRKEREKLGKEWKRKGTQAFRKQDFQAAVDNYSQAVKQCPWDISLYTNLALVSRDGKGRHVYLSHLVSYPMMQCKLILYRSTCTQYMYGHLLAWQL